MVTVLIPLSTLIRRHGLTIDGVLHVGAHTGEEAPAYHRSRVGPVWWVEANPELLPTLQRNLRPYRDQQVIGACCTDRDGDTATLHVTNNVQSSSILQLGTHEVVSPDVHYTHQVGVGTRTIDSLVDEHTIRANFLNCDTQGAELAILHGGEKFLAGCEALYLEVNAEPLYQGCGLLHDVTAWLYGRGFTVRQLEMAGSAGWGDCLFVRTPSR